MPRILPFLFTLAFLGLPALAPAARAEGYKVSQGDAETAIAQTLQEDGIGEKVRVNLVAQGLRQPLATYERDIKVYVEQLELDKERKKLSATLVFEADGQPMAPQAVTGRYETMQNLPVLNRAVKNGQVITEDDISLRDVVTSRILKNTVTEKSQLIGKTALRTISPARMIRTDELAAPSVITKGQGVTIHFMAQNLDIKGLGEALDSGAVGQTIRVRNQDSKHIVQGVVEDANSVVIYGTAGRPKQAAPLPAAPLPAALLQAAPLSAAATANAFKPTRPPALTREAPTIAPAAMESKSAIAAPSVAAQTELPALPAVIPDQEVGDAPMSQGMPDTDMSHAAAYKRPVSPDPIDVLENSHAR